MGIKNREHTLKHSQREDALNGKSIALVWTKYQFNILLCLLRTLKIDRSSVLLLIYNKAYGHGVEGKGFYRSIVYTAEKQSEIKNWPKIKKDIDALIKTIEFYPSNLFLRNYDSMFGRILLSEYPKSNVYIFEDGMASYKRRNIFGYPDGFKERMRTILLRFFFSNSTLRIMPLPKKNVNKAGLFESVDPWLNVVFVQLNLIKEDMDTNSSSYLQPITKHKVLILEQPLWQAGFKDQMLVDAYREMIRYILNHSVLSNSSIALKMHPSSNRLRIETILKKAHVEDKIEILDTTDNMEEMIFSDSLSSIQMIIGFYSSGLYLAKSLIKKEDVEIVAFSTENLNYHFNEIYKTLEGMGIIHGKELINK